MERRKGSRRLGLAGLLGALCGASWAGALSPLDAAFLTRHAPEIKGFERLAGQQAELIWTGQLAERSGANGLRFGCRADTLLVTGLGRQTTDAFFREVFAPLPAADTRRVAQAVGLPLLAGSAPRVQPRSGQVLRCRGGLLWVKDGFLNRGRGPGGYLLELGGDVTALAPLTVERSPVGKKVRLNSVSVAAGKFLKALEVRAGGRTTPLPTVAAGEERRIPAPVLVAAGPLTFTSRWTLPKSGRYQSVLWLEGGFWASRGQPLK